MSDLKSDVCFVGTGYPSRIEFLEAAADAVGKACSEFIEARRRIE